MVENLTKRFGAFAAVDNITFQAHRGEIFGFLGPNGAGKSTTIRILCGLLRPSSGRALVAGIDVARSRSGLVFHVHQVSMRMARYHPASQNGRLPPLIPQAMDVADLLL